MNLLFTAIRHQTATFASFHEGYQDPDATKSCLLPRNNDGKTLDWYIRISDNGSIFVVSRQSEVQILAAYVKGRIWAKYEIYFLFNNIDNVVAFELSMTIMHLSGE